MTAPLPKQKENRGSGFYKRVTLSGQLNSLLAGLHEEGRTPIIPCCGGAVKLENLALFGGMMKVLQMAPKANEMNRSL